MSLNKLCPRQVCEGLDSGHAYLVALAYPLTLVAASTVYAIKTRKAPGGFNEARAVAFTNYTTALLWLAFVPLYVVSSSHALRALTLSISLSLSALVQLACLFAPKVYTVLWRPQKNTKEGVMTHHRSSSLAPTPSPALHPASGIFFYFPRFRPERALPNFDKNQPTLLILLIKSTFLPHFILLILPKTYFLPNFF